MIEEFEFCKGCRWLVEGVCTKLGIENLKYCWEPVFPSTEIWCNICNEKLDTLEEWKEHWNKEHLLEYGSKDGPIAFPRIVFHPLKTTARKEK